MLYRRFSAIARRAAEGALAAFAVAACRGEQVTAPAAVALRITLPGSRPPVSAVSFGAPGMWVPVIAQPLGADSVPLGDVVAARWSSRDPAVVDVRDTTVAVGGAARPAAVITSRGYGATVIRASAVVAGRDVVAEFPVNVVPPAAR